MDAACAGRWWKMKRDNINEIDDFNVSLNSRGDFFLVVNEAEESANV